MSVNAETKRWNEAIDALLNGRWVDQEQLNYVFAYTDGEISEEEMRAGLG